jgi:hypothetical protein
MSATYQYEIVRHGKGKLGVKKAARDDYEEVIQEYARNGWRLVQVFAPGLMGGAPLYYDLIFEREV